MRRLSLLILAIISFVALNSPVFAATPAIQGWSWIDSNCDGIRQDEEPPANGQVLTSSPYLYRFGADGLPFTSDDKQLGILSIGSNGLYANEFDSSQMLLDELYRLSILQGGRPEGYVPTKYHVGDDPTRWSSLESNWTTTGFRIDANATVSGGNIGIAPVSCLAQWYTNHTYLPLAQH